MASGVLFATGLDWQPNGVNFLPSNWTGGNVNQLNTSFRVGPFGKGMRVFDTTNGPYKTVTGGPYTHVVLQFAFKMDTGVGGTNNWIEFLTNNATTIQFNMRVLSDGTIEARRGSTVVASSAAGVVAAASTEYTIEIRLLVDDTVGEVEVLLDGVQVLVGTGLDTKDTAFVGCTGFRVQNPVNGWNMDDIIFRDWSVISSFIGFHVVRPFMPDGAGDATDFTPSAGANWAAVDEVATDDDSTYVESATVGHKDLYNIATTGFTSASVLAVQVHHIARKTDGVLREIRPLLKHGATELAGATVALGTSYSRTSELFDDVPGGSGWTLAQVEALQVGQEVVT